ncbi:MAG: hypothetical protein JWO57_869 [Pseudonocardiales bacterium]|nr:hypothetical protein [Pseudonocardiales bacterium]
MLPAMTTPPRPALPGVGVAGITTLVAGAVLVLLSFTAFDWYGAASGADSRGAIRFHDLHSLAGLPGMPGLPKAYFGWLAWILLMVVILVGLAANMPSPATPALRAGGLLIGLAGAGATYVALSKLLDATGSSGGVFDHAKIGLWLALAGYVVAGAGAAVGARRV